MLTGVDEGCELGRMGSIGGEGKEGEEKLNEAGDEAL
jgi:hypothetical protein